MEEFPRNLAELEQRFSTEEDCCVYLRQLRWPTGFQCPRCHSDKYWSMKRGLQKCADCGYQVSVTAGTIFHRTHLSLRTWFRAVWWVTNQKQGVSALGLQRLLGLGSYETAWACLHKLRRAMVRLCQIITERISFPCVAGELYNSSLHGSDGVQVRSLT
jgi:transposase-like protein